MTGDVRATDIVREDVRDVIAGRQQVLDPLRQRHIFVTGGSGFLGTWIVELVAYLNEQHSFGTRVTVYSRQSRSLLARAPHLRRHDWLHFQDGDVRYLAEMPRDVAFVVHAAAVTDRRLFASCPSLVAETNSIGTARVLKAALLLDSLEKFVLLSSGLVYGSQTWSAHAIDEEFVGPLPRTTVAAVYAESKRMAEVFAQAAISEAKLPVVIIRPFAFVGPYQSLNLPWAVTDFIRDSFNGGPIRIMGDGAAVRSLMYASDYAFWTLAALARGESRSAYNVGSGDHVDLLSLAKLIAGQFRPEPSILINCGQGHSPSILVPNVAKAQSVLGVSVTVDLPKALQRSVEWNRLVRAS
jgi:nucleoside-diphosphate-sugar epimerase